MLGQEGVHMRLQAADYDDDTVMEYTPPEETNRRQRQREIEAEREREQKVQLCCPTAWFRSSGKYLSPDLHDDLLSLLPQLTLTC